MIKRKWLKSVKTDASKESYSSTSRGGGGGDGGEYLTIYPNHVKMKAIKVQVFPAKPNHSHSLKTAEDLLLMFHRKSRVFGVCNAEQWLRRLHRRTFRFIKVCYTIS